MTAKTVSRETALNALRCLASADEAIRRSKGTSNQFRSDTIAELENQLDVKVEVTKAQGRTPS